MKNKFLLLALALTTLTATTSIAGNCDSEASREFGPCKPIAEVNPQDSRFTTNVAGFDDREVPLDELSKATGVQQTISYTSILTKGNQHFSESELFTQTSDLIIGLDNEGNTQGHMYLILNGERFDGRMFRAAATVLQNGWKLSKGLIIRYRGLSQTDKDAVTKWLQSDDDIKAPTCVAAANKLLYGVLGFKNAPKNSYWMPGSYLKYLAANGLLNSEGDRLSAEIFVINTDIEQMWTNLPNWMKVPLFIGKVAFDPYTWAGNKKDK
jgi:hypothetical protein